jgi:hypothetical protein
MKSFPPGLRGFIVFLVSLQLASCGTIMYPERRGQKDNGPVGMRLDIGVVLLDGIGLLFFIIPGVIAYAVDFSNGTIYLPGTKGTKAGLDRRDLKIVKFDAKDYTPDLLQHIIREETGYDLSWQDKRLRAVKLTNEDELPVYFAQARAATAMQSN